MNMGVDATSNIHKTNTSAKLTRPLVVQAEPTKTESASQQPDKFTSSNSAEQETQVKVAPKKKPLFDMLVGFDEENDESLTSILDAYDEINSEAGEEEEAEPSSEEG